MVIQIRRTFNLGNYESLTIEGIGDNPDPNIARLLATQQILWAAQQEMIRIFNIRTLNVHSSPWEQVQLELSGITAELNGARR